MEGYNVGTLDKQNCVHRQLNSYMYVYMESFALKLILTTLVTLSLTNGHREKTEGLQISDCTQECKQSAMVYDK